jgi:hypothetical protein
MATERNKWIEAVAKIIELTQKGKIRWTTGFPIEPLTDSPNDRVHIVYQADHKGKTLRLYEVYSPGNSVLGREVDSWPKRTVLELLDPQAVSAWPFPASEILDHLLATVRYQVAGVKDFVDELLAEVT